MQPAAGAELRISSRSPPTFRSQIAVSQTASASGALAVPRLALSSQPSTRRTLNERSPITQSCPRISPSPASSLRPVRPRIPTSRLSRASAAALQRARSRASTPPASSCEFPAMKPAKTKTMSRAMSPPRSSFGALEAPRTAPLWLRQVPHIRYRTKLSTRALSGASQSRTPRANAPPANECSKLSQPGLPPRLHGNCPRPPR